MDINESSNGRDVDDWVKHFKAVIEGDVLPDERRGVFLLKNNSLKTEKKPKEKELSVTIVSPVARDIDSSKSELDEQKRNKHPSDIDPISHFPETLLAEKDSKHKRKRAYKKRSESTVKSKKSKNFLWNKY
jgi:hypothetical protein